MVALLDYPVKHIDGNLIFSHDGSVTAYYRLAGFNYEFLDHEDKFIPFHSQLAFLFNNRYDLHFISEPFPTNIDLILADTIASIQRKNYPLKEAGLQYFEYLSTYFEEQKMTQETSEYIQYIGVQLDPTKNKYRDGNIGVTLFQSLKELWNGLNAQVNRSVGLTSQDLLQADINAWHDQADLLKEQLQSGFLCKVEKARTAECLYLLEKEFSVTSSNADIQSREEFRSGEVVEGTEIVDGQEITYQTVRTNPRDFLELQGTNIEEHTATSLKLTKLDAADNENTYFTKYLVVHSMDSEMSFPHNEWFYLLQSRLPFPVSTSIRAYHQTNERIVKRLSNKRLEFIDQKQEAYKAGADTDLALHQSEQGAIQAEAYFQKSGQPAYACSIIFKVGATSQKEVNVRAEQLKQELLKYGMKIVAPFGEQIALAMEKLLGSRQINTDYKIEVESGVLAAMMFGATTSVGDNRGFYIGYTDRLRRPVFIQPDLAAKAYNIGNLEDSISAIVAGATGKGKSYFMNLYTTLSVLTGSQALIVDPKGDRKHWESLPLIDKTFISKWTLGSDLADRGCLDPFRTADSIENAKATAKDILAYLVDVDLRDTEYQMLALAVEAVASQEDPCIGAVLTYLEGMHEAEQYKMSNKKQQAIETLVDIFQALKNEKLASLLFGEVGQDFKVLKVDKPMQILMVEHLNLPDSDQTQSRKLLPSQKLSEAIMISITAFTQQYMFNQDRSIHKIILQDEASSIDANPSGRRMMDFIIRKGRYYNTTLLKGSQNATDHGNDVANVGMKFSFGLRKSEEAKEMLKFLNLPETDTNVQKLRTLEKGHCLFQDIYGRTTTIYIDPVFVEFERAFDSSTASEEERLREQNK